MMTSIVPYQSSLVHAMAQMAHSLFLVALSLSFLKSQPPPLTEHPPKLITFFFSIQGEALGVLMIAHSMGFVVVLVFVISTCLEPQFEQNLIRLFLFL